MNRSLSMLLGVAHAPMLVAVAFAHAFLDHALPAVGSAVNGSPAEVRLWFTQMLEPAFSTIRVVDRRGKQVDNGDPQVDRTDATQLRVTLPPVTPGTYRLSWRVVSVDTHVTVGDCTFDVVP